MSSGTLIDQETDAAQFTRLVEEHAGLVFAAVFTVIPRSEDADDIAQETFLRAWEKRGTLRDPRAAGAWLYRIARNTALAHVRKQQSRPTFVALDHEEGFDMVSRAPSPQQAAIDAELGGLLRNSIDNMPDAYRIPLVLSCLEECSTAQIAEVMGVSEDVVRQRLSRGRGMLRQEAESGLQKALNKRRSGRVMAAAVMALITARGANTASAAATPLVLTKGGLWLTGGILSVVVILFFLVLCGGEMASKAGEVRAAAQGGAAARAGGQRIVMTVTMVEPDGRPAANAIIAVTGRDLEIVSRTDADGVAVLSFMPPELFEVAGCSDLGLGRHFYRAEQAATNAGVVMRLVEKEKWVEPPVPDGWVGTQKMWN